MSDVSDLTVEEFQDTAPGGSVPGTKFPEARGHGYDVGAVDAYIEAHQARVGQERAATHDLRERANTLRDDVAALTASLDESTNPTYAGLGWHATTKLEHAEAEADAILAEAHQAAADIQELAERDAAELRADTAPRTDPAHDLEAERTRLYAEAEQDRERAQYDASTMLEEAHAAADEVRAVATAEAETMRAAADDEAQQAREAADQEVMAARRVLALEQERADGEAAEGREAAQRLAEQLVGAAEERVATAEQRAHDTTSAVESIREHAVAESQLLLEDARREAAEIIASGRADAESARNVADAESDQELIQARADLVYYQRRLAAIAAQIFHLHDSAMTEEDPADAEDPSADV